jgi:hypothetical protein
MNATGEDFVYSAFPKAVFRNEAVHSDTHRFLHGESCKPRVLNGVTVLPSNEHWGGPCGLGCPGVDRDIRHDPGVGIFHCVESTDWRT